MFFHLELLCLFLKRSQHDFLVSKREISTEKTKVMASTKYDLFMEVYNSHHSEPGAKAIRPASPKYLDAIWAAMFRIKSSFYMEHGVDFDTFKANETVQTFVNDFVKESRRRWRNNDANFKDMMRNCPTFYEELLPDFPIEEFKSVPNFETPEAQPQDVEMADMTNTPQTSRTRKPYKLFSQLDERQQINRAQLIHESIDPSDGHDGLIAATCRDFRQRGLHDVAFILEAIKDDAVLAKKLRFYIKSLGNIEEDTDADQAAIEPKGMNELSLLAETDMTKECYIKVRNFVNHKSGTNLLCGYDSVKDCKKITHPEHEVVSDEDVICKMQTLVNHTSNGYLSLHAIRKKIDNLVEKYGPVKIVIYWKGGMDGSGGHIIAQQSGSNIGNDSHIMVSILVPLQITAELPNGETEVVYTNPHCNSPVSARVLRMWCRKETEGPNGNFLIFYSSCHQFVTIVQCCL